MDATKQSQLNSVNIPSVRPETESGNEFSSLDSVQEVWWEGRNYINLSTTAPRLQSYLFRKRNDYNNFSLYLRSWNNCPSVIFKRGKKFPALLERFLQNTHTHTQKLLPKG